MAGGRSMYVRNGKIVMTKEENDLTLRRRGEDILKTRYNLSLSDLPEVLDKLGFSKKEYLIQYLDEDYRRLVFSIEETSGDGEKATVEFWRCSFNHRYPFIQVKNNGEEKIFTVQRKISVNQL